MFLRLRSLDGQQLDRWNSNRRSLDSPFALDAGCNLTKHHETNSSVSSSQCEVNILNASFVGISWGYSGKNLSAFGASFGTIVGLAVPTLTILCYRSQVSSFESS